MNEPSPRFSPLRPPPSSARVLVLLLGPLLWLASLIAVSLVVASGQAAGVGLVVVVVSLLIWFPVMLLSRRRRVRDEQEAEHPTAG